MIVIVESPEERRSGTIEVVTRTGPDGVSTCNGRVIGAATAAEYVEHLLREQGFPSVNPEHGPFYYRVAVD